jgi:hypothetical protein
LLLSRECRAHSKSAPKCVQPGERGVPPRRRTACRLGSALSNCAIAEAVANGAAFTFDCCCGTEHSYGSRLQLLKGSPPPVNETSNAPLDQAPHTGKRDTRRGHPAAEATMATTTTQLSRPHNPRAGSDEHDAVTSTEAGDQPSESDSDNIPAASGAAIRVGVALDTDRGESKASAPVGVSVESLASVELESETTRRGAGADSTEQRPRTSPMQNACRSVRDLGCIVGCENMTPPELWVPRASICNSSCVHRVQMPVFECKRCSKSDGER